MKLWKVLIADNQPISRAGIKLVLEGTADLKVIGEATSGQQAISLCKNLQPEIILMDVNMPNGNGVEATTIIHRLFPHILIIGISGFRHEEIQHEIIRAGAVGYISKETDFEMMLAEIHTIIQGVSQISSCPSNSFDLTASEYRILGLLAEGYDRQQIANQLNLSINTVKMHFRNLYQKLGVANANDAIKVALLNHLLS